MATLLNATPREARVAEAEVLRDGRKRLTRFLEVGNRLVLPEELGFSPGTADIFDDAPEGWGGLLLTDHHITDELGPKGKDTRPILELVFEQISPTAETQLGGRTERELPDGRKGYELTWLQFSVNAFVPGTVGTDTDPNDAEAFLQAVEGPDDGTVRTIKRTYVYAGELAIDTQTKNNGALSVVTITSAKTVPSTPSGYTLIGQPIQNPNGLPIYTYTFAMGTGEVSRQIEYRQSPDQGANGVTITTIKYLTVPSVSSDPTTGPASSENIGSTYENADGYKVWTSIYANGQGTILTSTETKNGGKLKVYKTTSINAAPSTPAATIGGTVVLVEALKHNGSRFDSGILIYEYTWAEGEGEISLEVTYSQSVDQGTNGITKSVIRYLTASSVSSDPTSAPSGSVNVGVTWEDVEGYRIWTSRYAKGVGTVSTEKEIKENGNLILYKTVALGSAPSTPSATIGGTVTLIDDGSRVDSDVTIFEYRWAEGHGLAIDESSESEIGALVIYHRVSLGVAPSAPTATIGGTVTQYEASNRSGDGYAIYDYRWAEGNGVTSSDVAGEEDGALVYLVIQRASSKLTPTYPGTGTAYLVRLKQESKEGHYLNTAIWKKPPASDTYNKTVDFDMPGQIEPTSPDPGYVLVAGNQKMRILASVTVDYSTSQITDTPWTVEAWPAFSESYVVASNGQTVSRQWGHVGYLSGGLDLSGATDTYNGVAVSGYALVVLASTPTAPPSGDTTLHVDNDPYLVDVTGTKVYRRTKMSYTF